MGVCFLHGAILNIHKYPKYTYNINMLSEKMCEEIDLFRRDCKRWSLCIFVVLLLSTSFLMYNSACLGVFTVDPLGISIVAYQGQSLWLSLNTCLAKRWCLQWLDRNYKAAVPALSSIDSKNFPTYPWNIPKPPPTKEFLHLGGLGMSGVCSKDMLGFS